MPVMDGWRQRRKSEKLDRPDAMTVPNNRNDGKPLAEDIRQAKEARDERTFVKADSIRKILYRALSRYMSGNKQYTEL